MSNPLKTAACEEIDRHASELHGLSHSIWEHPELNFEEKHAHQVLTDFLEKQGFHVERQYKLETAFRATYGEGPGPHVALLCEYDALPGIGHACGHNLIAQVGVAAGLGAKAALKASGKHFPGKITVLGTPAEEGGGGKVDLINAGAFDGVDVAMMAHPSKATFSKPKSLVMDAFTIQYIGKAAHASSSPWEGINALDAAVLAYQNVSVLRQQFKPTWRVHGIITSGGVKPNIIPEFSELRYMCRTPCVVEMKTLQSKLKDCFTSAAAATGCKVEFVHDQKPYEDLLSNSTLATLFEENAAGLGVDICSDPAVTQRFGGSTDMGNVSHVVPSLQPKFYIGTTASIHSTEYTAAAGSPTAQPYTQTIGKALAMVTLDILQQPQLMSKIKEDFDRDTQR
ncbi:xaa-Arg dipeptidase-like [Liolophura sinensis]|uniref:xaa-Arg dipeptidase-like n=1 Tax=Liolophura sinensis TaxID=3198878 RepID=UPI00315981A5